MPIKQTRESIEAELNASKRYRFLKKFEEIMEDWDELESNLCAREDQLGLPYQSKPIVERMAAVGMPKEAIQRVRTWLAVISGMCRTRNTKDLPEDIRRELAETADTESSALDQLQDVLDAARHPKR